MENINTNTKNKIKKQVTFAPLVKVKQLSNICLLDILNNHHSDLDNEFLMDMLYRYIESR